MKLLLLLGLALAAAALLLPPSQSSSLDPFAAPTVASSIAAACKATLYPDACSAAFASIAGHGPPKTPTELFDISVYFAMEHAHFTRSLAYNLSFPPNDRAPYPPTGSHDCVELIDDTVELLTNALNQERRPSKADVDTWLSAALTNQVTCSESLVIKPPVDKDLIEAQSINLTRFVSNSLALLKHMENERPSRRLTAPSTTHGFPEWLSESDRRLLEAAPEDLKPDAVVALDGSGTHRSINEALAFVSLLAGTGGRTVISIKEGTYKEYIRVPTKQKNVMLVGAGKGVSVVVGDRSNSGGWTTYESATVAGQGAGFIARDLTIVNSAGPGGGQAVALRVSGDRAVIYRCSLQGYQDTLYSHSNRQFYRETDIYGTVDFIFGNAAAVFQSCNISQRKPSVANTITAQSRLDPNQNTGFVIQGSRIVAASDLAQVKGQLPTYFGRPWRQYSRVVVMQTYVDDSVNPRGWQAWTGGASLDKVYYGEYGNTGPGAGTGGRVQAAGVHATMSSTEAAQFTVSNFIDGDSWIPRTGVPYNGGL